MRTRRSLTPPRQRPHPRPNRPLRRLPRRSDRGSRCPRPAAEAEPPAADAEAAQPAATDGDEEPAAGDRGRGRQARTGRSRAGRAGRGADRRGSQGLRPVRSSSGGSPEEHRVRAEPTSVPLLHLRPAGERPEVVPRIGHREAGPRARHLRRTRARTLSRSPKGKLGRTERDDQWTDSTSSPIERARS